MIDKYFKYRTSLISFFPSHWPRTLNDGREFFLRRPENDFYPGQVDISVKFIECNDGVLASVTYHDVFLEEFLRVWVKGLKGEVSAVLEYKKSKATKKICNSIKKGRYLEEFPLHIDI